MEIHKFGGASISTAQRIQNIPSIISYMKAGKKVFVISALGKTTNALEYVSTQYFEGKKEMALASLKKIKEDHLELAASLLPGEAFSNCKNILADHFIEIEKSLDKNLNEDYNFFYDQVISFGELLSSKLVSFYLTEMGIENCWIDARQVIKTNEHFREAGILWDAVAEKMKTVIGPVLNKCDIVITQGFIGGTIGNQSTTLGREGSDFSAAVFANILKAQSVTIWKDVDGVMNADPKQIADAVVIPHLNYKEVIEMSYYGAQVIHPKTIKPLQNENIPLYVRAFLNSSLPGTVIDNKAPKALPPMIVYKFNQVLMSFQTKDFSFIEGKPSGELNEIFAASLVKANLSQNTAITLLICMDDIEEKRNFIFQNADGFEMAVTTGLTLLTIRHYTSQIIESLTYGKDILLKQETDTTVQILYKE